MLDVGVSWCKSLEGTRYFSWTVVPWYSGTVVQWYCRGTVVNVGVTELLWSSNIIQPGSDWRKQG